MSSRVCRIHSLTVVTPRPLTPRPLTPYAAGLIAAVVLLVVSIIGMYSVAKDMNKASPSTSGEGTGGNEMKMFISNPNISFVSNHDRALNRIKVIIRNMFTIYTIALDKLYKLELLK